MRHARGNRRSTAARRTGRSRIQTRRASGQRWSLASFVEIHVGAGLCLARGTARTGFEYRDPCACPLIPAPFTPGLTVEGADPSRKRQLRVAQRTRAARGDALMQLADWTSGRGKPLHPHPHVFDAFHFGHLSMLCSSCRGVDKGSAHRGQSLRRAGRQRGPIVMLATWPAGRSGNRFKAETPSPSAMRASAHRRVGVTSQNPADA